MDSQSGLKEEKEQIKGSQDIINQLSVILRTSQIHDTSNIAVITSIEKFLSLFNQYYGDESSLIIDLVGEFFYINDKRVRYALEYLLNFDFLIKEFRKRQLGRVIFRNNLKSTDLQLFLKAFNLAGSSNTPYETMAEILSQSENIDIDRLKKIMEGNVDARKLVKKIYYNAVSYSKGVINKIKSGEKVNIKKAKRIVETMVDQILEEEKLLLGMTAIKDYDEYTYYHSVNVSILSIALGQRLGLSKKLLTELGLVALFHDIGKVEIPNEILNKSTNFTDEEWNLIKAHPKWGLRAILKIKGLDEISMRSAIVAFEHHMNYDLSGYPKVKSYKELDLFSRIVSVVDQYDAMTSSRVYSRIPLAPDKALSIMMERAGTQLDPLLFKFFVNMVGVFPIGTLVMLDTKELGLVYESDIVYSDRPKVLIIVDSEGKNVNGPIVDLTEKDERGRFIRTIVKTLDPNKYRINLAEYLL
jgi:HD-GYP domain-containing protein (c-di-GMP phosphodiesterase class II)